MKRLISTLHRVRRAAAEQGFRSRTVGWVWAVALVFHLLALLLVQDITLFHYDLFVSGHFDLKSIQYVELPEARREESTEREVAVTVPPPSTLEGARAPEKAVESAMKPTWNPMVVRVPKKSSTTVEEVQVLGLSAPLERVLYLVDISGSMWTRVSGRRIFEYARAEVARSVSLLPAGMEFNVVYYSDEMVPLFREMAPASAENKERARVFLQRLPDLSGATNFFKVLKLAFSMNPDGIFLFTDGITQQAPWRVSQQFRILHETLSPSTRVFVVGFASEGENEQSELLAQLCGSTKGDFQRFPFPPPAPLPTSDGLKKKKK